MIAAGSLLGLCVHERSRVNAQVEEIRRRPGALEMFRAQDYGFGVDSPEVSPLVVEAEAFASYVNPAPPVESLPPPAPQAPARSRPTPTVRPRASSVAFKLHGTSVYPDRPERSMALISEPGGSEGERKWVREGAALGHFVVEEIRRGVVVLSDGDAVREMTVEPSPGRRSLVRSYTASVARADAGGSPERLEADSNAVAEPATR